MYWLMGDKAAREASGIDDDFEDLDDGEVSAYICGFIEKALGILFKISPTQTAALEFIAKALTNQGISNELQIWAKPPMDTELN